jgi:uncharacterized cupredoxin-like copper-binding protein
MKTSHSATTLRTDTAPGAERSGRARRGRRLLIGALAPAVAALALAACSSGGSASSSTSNAAPATNQSAAATNVSLQVLTSGPGHSDWPRFAPASFTVSKSGPITITITNHDDGTSPMSTSLESYDAVQGGTETVDGAAVTSVPNSQLSHTFTVPGLGVYIVIPAAPTGGTNTIVFTFTPKKSGSFSWQCYAPCGSGSDGMGGAMAADKWMKGTMTVA